MSTLTINTIDAKEEFSELIHRVSHNKERIILTRRGNEIAAIIPMEDLYFIQRAQSKNDFEEALEALREARQSGIVTLEDLKAEIG